jgi:hypothetical protein
LRLPGRGVACRDWLRAAACGAWRVRASGRAHGRHTFARTWRDAYVGSHTLGRPRRDTHAGAYPAGHTRRDAYVGTHLSEPTCRVGRVGTHTSGRARRRACRDAPVRDRYVGIRTSGRTGRARMPGRTSRDAPVELRTAGCAWRFEHVGTERLRNKPIAATLAGLAINHPTRRANVAGHSAVVAEIRCSVSAQTRSAARRSTARASRRSAS